MLQRSLDMTKTVIHRCVDKTIDITVPITLVAFLCVVFLCVVFAIPAVCYCLLPAPYSWAGIGLYYWCWIAVIWGKNKDVFVIK